METDMPEEHIGGYLPKESDHLFVESAWAYDAHIVSDPAERFYRMPQGYKRAGDILIHQTAVDVIDRKNIIYAALFCYRQSIELFLKSLIEEFSNGKTYKPVHTHELKELWERFTNIAKEHPEYDSLTGLTTAENLVMEMDNADKKSDGFRFPKERNGASFSFGDRGIDQNNLCDVMDRLQNFFECTRYWLIDDRIG